MAWDKTIPAGNTKVNIGDNGIRDNNDAIEAAVDLEHEFSTGGTQSGRHKFAIQSAATRDAASPAYVNGGISLTTGIKTNAVMQYYNSGWVDIDVNQPTLVRRDEQNQFDTCQFAGTETLTISASAITPDLSSSPWKQVILTENITINAPTNKVASHVTAFQLVLIQDGTGSRTVTWNSEYKSASGAVQIGTAAGSLTLLDIRQYNTNDFLVTSLPDFAQAIT